MTPPPRMVPKWSWWSRCLRCHLGDHGRCTDGATHSTTRGVFVFRCTCPRHPNRSNR